MPRALTLCSFIDEAGRACNALVPRGMCEPHRLATRRAADARRPSSTARGYDARWRATAASYLAAHPICECDDPDCRELSTDVHHKDGLGPSGPRGHARTNLKALAHDCHSRLTAQLQPGGFLARRTAS